jgi:DNA-directed RNA polymerase subunit F
MNVKSEEDVSIHEAKEIMKNRKEDEELVYDQKICFEYLEKVAKLTPTKLKSIVEELNKISILKPRYIALIVNILPDTEEEVEMLFSKERTNLKKDEIKKIVEIVNKHK